MVAWSGLFASAVILLEKLYLTPIEEKPKWVLLVVLIGLGLETLGLEHPIKVM